MIRFALVFSLFLWAGGGPLARAATALASPPSAHIVLQGMVCAYCAQGFERALIRHREVSSVEVRLRTHDAIIQFREGASLSETELRQVAKEAGLDVSAVNVGEIAVRE
jgi:mercuric ion binding protein